MATTERPASETADAASEAAGAIAAAELVQLIVRADGDALAAAGIIASACRATQVPYHVGIVRTAAELETRLSGADETATPVVVGATDADALSLDPSGPVSPLAHRIATELDRPPASGLALAGIVAAGDVPSQVAPSLLKAAGLDRTGGVSLPTADVVDGLAHTTLIHASFSGDPEAVRAAVADLAPEAADPITPDGDDKRLASFVALAAGGAPEATSRAATAVERILRPYPIDGPFRNVAGTADVLTALAEGAPGLAVSVAVGNGAPEGALETWRTHGLEAHTGLRGAETERYAGVQVVHTDGPVETVARLSRDFRSPEPVALAIGEGEAAAASVETPVDDALSVAAQAANGSALSRGSTGYLQFDGDATAVIEAFRGALS